MAKRRIDEVQDTAGAEDQPPAGADAGESAEPRRLRRGKQDKARLKIMITMSAEVVRRLRHAAVAEDMQPGELVEKLIDGPLRPYTMSIRGRRLFSQDGEAA